MRVYVHWVDARMLFRIGFTESETEVYGQRVYRVFVAKDGAREKDWIE